MNELDPTHLPQKWAAKCFNITSSALQKWDVKPVLKKGRVAYYSVSELIEYWKAREITPPEKLDLSQERARLAKAQTAKYELELEMMKGNLIPAEQIELYWVGMVENMKARLLSIPTKSAQIAVACTELHQIENGVRELIYEALNEIAKHGIPAARAGEIDGVSSSGAPAESKRERVGGPKKKTKQRSKRRARAVEN